MSGDHLGATLIDAFRTLRPETTLAGVGGPAMLNAGLQPCFPMEPLSVMGLTEVLPRLPGLLALRKEIVNHVVMTGYDALLTIDSPEFSLGLARRVKKTCPRMPCVHYVSPTVWAWRPGRVRTIAASVDHVMTLLPFETDHLRRAGIVSTFTGHPLADRERPGNADIAAAREEMGLAPNSRLILLLPGSRAGEVRRHSGCFAAVAAALSARHSELEFVVVTTEATRPIIEGSGVAWPPATHIFCSGRRDADEADAVKFALFAAAHAALAVSGTVSLELAAMRTPMVIAYALNWISSRILSAMLTVDTVTLVNLISNTRLVNEHLGHRINRAAIIEDMAAIIEDTDVRAHQLAAFKAVMEQLRHPDGPAGEQAAQTFLTLLESSSHPPR